MGRAHLFLRGRKLAVALNESLRDRSMVEAKKKTPLEKKKKLQKDKL